MDYLTKSFTLVAVCLAFASQALANGSHDCTCKFPKAIQLVNNAYVCERCPHGFHAQKHNIGGYDQATCECEASRFKFDGQCVAKWWCKSGGGKNTAACKAINNAILTHSTPAPATGAVAASPAPAIAAPHPAPAVAATPAAPKATGRHVPGKYWCKNGGKNTPECKAKAKAADAKTVSSTRNNRSSRRHVPGKYWCKNGGKDTPECKNAAASMDDHDDDDDDDDDDHDDDHHHHHHHHHNHHHHD